MKARDIIIVLILFAGVIAAVWYGIDRLAGDDNTTTKNELDPKNTEEFMDAIRDSDYITVETFLKKGADPNGIGEYDRTPMQVAVESKNTDMVKLLIQYKGNVNKTDKDGISLLERAIERYDISMVECLLQAGVNLNLTNKDGETVLWKAVEMGDISIIGLLIQKGSNLKASNFKGQTVMFQKIRENEEETVKYLISKGLEIDATSNEKENAAFVHLSNGDQFQALLANGLNPNLVNKKQESLLLEAIDTEQLPRVNDLLKAGANPNQKNKYKESALQMTIRRGNLATVQLLLSHGADVNSVDEYGETPLMEATKRQKISVVSALLSTKKVNINKKNSSGLTALQLAKETNNKAILSLLENAK